MILIKGIAKSLLSALMIELIVIMLSETLFESGFKLSRHHSFVQTTISNNNVSVSSCSIISVVNWLGVDLRESFS
jgi:hypothetical protein